MSYAVVTTKVDPQTKKAAQKTAESLGIPLSIVIKAFLKQFIRIQSVTFSVQDESPTNSLIKTIKQAERDRKAGKASPVFRNGEEAVKWLEKQNI